VVLERFVCEKYMKTKKKKICAPDIFIASQEEEAPELQTVVSSSTKNKPPKPLRSCPIFFPIFGSHPFLRCRYFIHDLQQLKIPDILYPLHI
jgi:hypothetical protein